LLNTLSGGITSIITTSSSKASILGSISPTADSHCFAPVSFTNKVTQTLPVIATRSYSQLLRFMLYTSGSQPGCRQILA